MQLKWRIGQVLQFPVGDMDTNETMAMKHQLTHSQWHPQTGKKRSSVISQGRVDQNAITSHITGIQGWKDDVVLVKVRKLRGSSRPNGFHDFFHEVTPHRCRWAPRIPFMFTCSLQDIQDQDATVMRSTQFAHSHLSHHLCQFLKAHRTIDGEALGFHLLASWFHCVLDGFQLASIFRLVQLLDVLVGEQANKSCRLGHADILCIMIVSCHTCRTQNLLPDFLDVWSFKNLIKRLLVSHCLIAWSKTSP